MVNSYPNSDPRKRMNMFGPGSQWYLSGEGLVAYPRDDWQHRKYSTLVNPNSRGYDINNYAGSGTNRRVIRFADVLLMYAEALNEQRAKFSPEARDAVNRVRSRVGLPGIAAMKTDWKRKEPGLLKQSWPMPWQRSTPPTGQQWPSY